MENILPIVKTYQENAGWEVEWDYQECEASNVLNERRDYIEGYINGFIDANGLTNKHITCLSSQVGHFKKLNKKQAEAIKEMLEKLLWPIVRKRHQKLVYNANLPHNKIKGC